jgi:hypothetical protein
MGILQEATGDGYLKAGFLGFQGSGKTFTAVELAIGVIKFFKLDGPIAMYDTEKGSVYVRERIRKELGRPLLVAKSRSLDDLMTFAREVEESHAIAIVDSITHVWREVCESYLKERMEAHRRKGYKNISNRLEFSDWSTIKGRWAAWPDWYLNSAAHVIVCGRAGFEYDMDKDEDGKKELIKTGIKMKVEGEFGFEPSLLIEMQREYVTDKRGHLSDKREVINRAIILKDRFSLIDGMTCEDPTFDFFKPHVELLTPGAHTAIDTSQRTKFGLSDQGDDWGREKNTREVLSEEIQAALVRVWPSQTGDDKRAKSDALARYWGTSSWKKISELTPSPQMRSGLDAFLNDHPNARPPERVAAPAPSPAAVERAAAAAPASHPAPEIQPTCGACGVPIESGKYCPACDMPDLSAAPAPATVTGGAS